MYMIFMITNDKKNTVKKKDKRIAEQQNKRTNSTSTKASKIIKKNRGWIYNFERKLKKKTKNYSLFSSKHQEGRKLSPKKTKNSEILIKLNAKKRKNSEILFKLNAREKKFGNFKQNSEILIKLSAKKTKKFKIREF